jgi:hypothetical protein
MTAPMADVPQMASGAILAQATIDSIRDGGRDVEIAWLKLSELAAVHGRHSPACRAFVTELAKRAAQ